VRERRYGYTQSCWTGSYRDTRGSSLSGPTSNRTRTLTPWPALEASFPYGG
jgi:hypothetical protein